MAKKSKKTLTKDEIKAKLKITSQTSVKDVEEFMPIVEMIARKESNQIPNNVISYDELLNTGLIAVDKLIKTANKTKDTEYNSSYIAQSVKWAMKDEVRVRQAWYGVKKTDPGSKSAGTKVAPKAKKGKNSDPSETTVINTVEDARKAVFEVIMSVESLEEDVGFTPADENAAEHLEHLELLEMKDSLRKSVAKLPDNLKRVIEMRFYEGLSGNEAAEKLNVTPSRISHMINEAIKRLKIFMTAEGYKDE